MLFFCLKDRFSTGLLAACGFIIFLLLIALVFVIDTATDSLFDRLFLFTANGK